MMTSRGGDADPMYLQGSVEAWVGVCANVPLDLDLDLDLGLAASKHPAQWAGHAAERGHVASGVG